MRRLGVLPGFRLTVALATSLSAGCEGGRPRAPAGPVRVGLLDSGLHTRDPAAGLGADNHWGFSSPEVDRLLHEARVAPTLLDRRHALQQAMDRVLVELPMVPLVIPHDLYVISGVVRGLAEPIGDFVLPEVFGHAPGLQAAPALDREAAPRRLAEAGTPTRPLRLEALAADVALVPLCRVLDRCAFAPGLELTPRMDRRIRAQDMRWTAPPPGARLP